MIDNTNIPQVKVWDPLVRFFHWTLVLAFAVTYLTEEDAMLLHSWAGYYIIALLIIRIIWGFTGTRHARFSDFVFPLATVKSYLKDILAFRAQRYIGHNPAGGAMIMLLMFSLIFTTITGLLIYGAEEHAGPLASWFIEENELIEDILEELHEFFANFTLLLVVVHIGGVIYESILHKESLVKAMFTGYKRKD